MVAEPFDIDVERERVEVVVPTDEQCRVLAHPPVSEFDREQHVRQFRPGVGVERVVAARELEVVEIERGAAVDVRGGDDDSGRGRGPDNDCCSLLPVLTGTGVVSTGKKLQQSL